jgi:hypothetical protein
MRPVFISGEYAMPLLDPKEFPLGDKVYVLSKFPATVGREIMMTYVPSGMPKVGDYTTNEALMYKMMKYVGVQIDGRDEPLMLTTPQLVDNHVPDGESLMRLEFAMASHNFAFFQNGRLSGILELAAAKATDSLSKILMDLLPVLSQKQETAAQVSQN